MKLRHLAFFLFLLSFYFAAMSARSQCVPATPEQCPDPENNGQVCPDSLVVAHIGQLYSQVATIKPPASYLLDTIEIPLDHAQLMEVGNLPSGITWQTNAENNIFIAGEYYCVLMEGDPDSAGEYALRIKVDIYAVVFPGFPAIKVATVIDSTSLTLIVLDDAGIKGYENASLFVCQNFPNPFQFDTRIDFYAEMAGTVDFEVYSLLGQRVYVQQINSTNGKNSMLFNGQMLPGGPYFYIFRSANYKSTGFMIRKD